MAASTIVKNFTDGAITGADDNGNSGTVNCAAGDFSVSGLMADGRNVADYESRGSLCSVRKTTRAYPQISFSAHYREAWDASGFKALALGMTAGFVSTQATNPHQLRRRDAYLGVRGLRGYLRLHRGRPVRGVVHLRCQG